MEKRNRKQYETIGRRVDRMFPQIAALVMAQSNCKKILYDYRDIDLLVRVFAEYYGVEFPDCLKRFSARESTYMRIKFTTVALLCFDPGTLQGPYYQVTKAGLRQRIAETLHSNVSLISQYIPKARVYLHAYEDFSQEVLQLLAVVKLEKAKD